MGIRYYAYPVPGDRIDDARRDPSPFLGVDPLADAWRLVPVPPEKLGGIRPGRLSYIDPDKPRPTMLYLDKAYRVFQDLFSGGAGESARESYALVEGEPTMSFAEGYSCTPWLRVLDVAHTAAIAADLRQVDLVADDNPLLSRGLTWSAPVINDYLVTARMFMADRAAAGDGVLYTIT
ncbi:hypothetical protein ACLQ3C_01970 [Gordonia sp. DT30]|uniref:hypothetical protein n=1 Tax=Gordonia sp. DT30 TaxID=3416546 RepID=UPI003CFBB6DF